MNLVEKSDEGVSLPGAGYEEYHVLHETQK